MQTTVFLAIYYNINFLQPYLTLCYISTDFLQKVVLICHIYFISKAFTLI